MFASLLEEILLWTLKEKTRKFIQLESLMNEKVFKYSTFYHILKANKVKKPYGIPSFYLKKYAPALRYYVQAIFFAPSSTIFSPKI